MTADNNRLPIPFHVLFSLYEIHELNCYEYYESFQVKSGWTVVDCGSQVGIFAAKDAKQIGKSGLLVAVELNPLAIKVLRRDLRSNGIKNTVLCQSALSDSEGTAEFSLVDITWGALYSRGGRLIRVQTATIDKVFADLKSERVNLQKN